MYHMYICASVGVCVRMCAMYECMYTHIYMYIYTCIYTHIYTYMYICMYIHI